ncbi:MAG TPA: DNA-processing protein DprA [Micropepsaceae bacterium]|jgi:DNA processing protein|nr:DNA-processing protein DprA [Micropepsaceae bacterium]
MAGRPLRDDERIAWLRLARTESVGPATFAALIARFSDVREALDAAPRLARRGGAKELRIPTQTEAQIELEALARLGGRMLASVEPDYPAGLAALDPAPPLISVLGHIPLLKRDMVAMVGARNASALGIKFAANLAADLGAAGLVIVSGLARGIDHAAHRGTLETGTVAVLAGGVDSVYPPEHQNLYDEMKARGALVSEMPLGMAPLSRHFPRRNRLISGMARGVVVIEAAERSGSLITANYALEQGREVFAVPGSPLDPRSKGANRLIREGATLTECADDVLAALRPILGHAFGEPTHHQSSSPPADQAAMEQEADRVRLQVEEKLGPAPVEIDEIIRQCGATPAAVLTVLLELELAGRVQRHPGNRVSWR